MRCATRRTRSSPHDLFYSFYYDSWQAVLAYRSALEQVPAEFAEPAAAVLKLL